MRAADLPGDAAARCSPSDRSVVNRRRAEFDRGRTAGDGADCRRASNHTSGTRSTLLGDMRRVYSRARAHIGGVTAVHTASSPLRKLVARPVLPPIIE